MKKIACIIDDDPFYLMGVTRLIEIHSLCDTMHIYKNGKEAIEGLNGLINTPSLIPDIILLDLNMPIMDGWEFLDVFVKQKIELSKEVTIYIVSSSINSEDLERAQEYSDVTDYVIKPVNAETLKEILSN